MTEHKEAELVKIFTNKDNNKRVYVYTIYIVKTFGFWFLKSRNVELLTTHSIEETREGKAQEKLRVIFPDLKVVC